MSSSPVCRPLGSTFETRTETAELGVPKVRVCRWQVTAVIDGKEQVALQEWWLEEPPPDIPPPPPTEPSRLTEE